MKEISLDILMIRDKEYFRKHPECDCYIREYITNEMPYPKAEQPPYVLVTKINDGVRARQSLWELPNSVESDI